MDGISFTLRKGETLGIVGESGSGKSVTMLSMMRLVPIPPGIIVSGKIVLDGEDLLQLTEGEMSKVWGSKIGLIIQDPMRSLKPVFTIGNQVTEAIRIHQKLPKKRVFEQALEVLRKVNIPAVESRVRDYPHRMSGGMRQRVVGAIGISCEPMVLIADEPTTSFDVTIQAQYLKLLRDIQQESNLALIFVIHDFGIVAKMCDRVAVMYAGKIVEMGNVRDIFNHPSHPSTEALLASVPKMEEDIVFHRLFSTVCFPPFVFHRLFSTVCFPPFVFHRLFSTVCFPPFVFHRRTAAHIARPSYGVPVRPRCQYVMNQCRQEYPPQVNRTESRYASCWRLA